MKMVLMALVFLFFLLFFSRRVNSFISSHDGANMVSSLFIPGSQAARRIQARLRSATKELSTTSAAILENIEGGPIPKKNREFRINGWRWHTQAVIRDLDRFEGVMKRSQEDSSLTKHELVDRLQRCQAFVCDFNWGALMRVENEIFYPWLRDLLPEQSKVLAQEFTKSHAQVRSLSSRLRAECKNVRHGSPDTFHRVLNTLEEMRTVAHRSQDLQENIFVPFIAAYVPVKEQEVFNRRVIKKLGLLEAQVHLVGMRDAIDGNVVEQKRFREQIPRVVQASIPVWRKAIYTRKTQCLNYANVDVNQDVQ